ncbi:MAG: AmmeMemoRadiSam system radical SAM enzyme [Pontiellaceae bacterium]|nr:AmmeMemoRadiSam system radical SAM enzyme [Pontiellaceae bacterium]MBN2786125.1 AmmeMemoRadiSam system radical SAM enzyme [Pontiellaceae bacterium]
MLGLNEIGDCGVRKNESGTIVCATYGYPCALNIDPVEKKPVFHFLPGSSILSMATAGCNLHCKQCQNWRISQQIHSINELSKYIPPEDIVTLAVDHACPSIAYTYTEPLVSFEYTYDCCRAAHQAGKKNVLVTAAYINPEPLKQICKYVDAANVDLKSFSDPFYEAICGARLKPVLKSLRIMKDSGVMIEVTNLLIPKLNDSSEETKKLSDWLLNTLGENTPLHFSRFFPQNQLEHLEATPAETLLNARSIALKSGLKHVYIGNLSHGEGECTYCPNCGKLLIERSGYTVLLNTMKNGCCQACNRSVYGIWN